MNSGSIVPTGFSYTLCCSTCRCSNCSLETARLKNPDNSIYDCCLTRTRTTGYYRNTVIYRIDYCTLLLIRKFNTATYFAISDKVFYIGRKRFKSCLTESKQISANLLLSAKKAV